MGDFIPYYVCNVYFFPHYGPNGTDFIPHYRSVARIMGLEFYFLDLFQISLPRMGEFMPYYECSVYFIPQYGPDGTDFIPHNRSVARIMGLDFYFLDLFQISLPSMGDFIRSYECNVYFIPHYGPDGTYFILHYSSVARIMRLEF